MNVIETLEREEMARLNRTIPAFAPGDTVIVNVSVVEGANSPLELIPRGLAGGLVRASVHYFTNDAELERTAALVGSM